MFTAFDYPDLDNNGRYHFGGKDIALVVLITSKLLFVRAGLFRYILRPLLRCLGVQSFERQQSMAEQVYTGLVYSVSAIYGAYFVGWPQLDLLGLESLWSGASGEGVLTEFKVFVLGQCALRLAELVAVFVEDENRPGYYRRIAIHYLVAGVLACAGLLGQAKFAGLVVLAIDLPTVMAAASGSACLQQVMNAVAGGVAIVSALVVLPSLVYASVRCGSLADTRLSAQCWTLMGSMAALCALQGVQTKSLWWGSTTSAHAPDMSKKTFIVSIKFIRPFTFETENRGTSQATGFIVDASNGIILTNRHVVSAGPVVARAIFNNHEEIELKAIYRDPIHDFGFFKFDPALIKHTKLEEIALYPEGAKVGVDIRVIGNNAGQKVSILASSISLIDRNVPELGEMTYNDSNTFYIQASTNGSGGSSGSPMINIAGQAVAIVSAGLTKASTDLYLPLDRVKCVLECIQAQTEVKRGTIQTTFQYRSYDEVRRLGVSDTVENNVRQDVPTGVGMMVVKTVLPDGPGHIAGLEEGDVLYRINGKTVAHFVLLEELLDGNVDQTLDITVIRGNTSKDVKVNVQNLHALEPSQMLQVGGTTMTNLSFQLANYYRVPALGVIANWLFCILEEATAVKPYVLKSINGKAVANITQVIDVIKTIGNNECVPVKYFHISEYYDNCLIDGSIKISHLWNQVALYTRNDCTGLWDKESITDLPPARDIEPTNVIFPVIKNADVAKLKDVVHSIVKVKCMIPIFIEGNVNRVNAGYGAIIDAEKGLVVVSRETVSSTACRITITIAGTAIIPAKLRFQHPTVSYAIVQYDPKHIGTTKVQAIKFSENVLEAGDSIRMLAMSRYETPVCLNARVSNILPIETMSFEPPRWRSINVEVAQLDNPTATNYGFGIIVDENGDAQALWLEYIKAKKTMGVGGLSVQALVPALRALQRDEEPEPRSLKAEITPITIVKARQAGLSNERSNELQSTASTRSQLYQIKRVEALSKAKGVLQELDIVVSINGKLVRTLEDFDAQFTNPTLEIVVLRDSQEHTLQVETTESKQEVGKVVFWAGALFHAPHKTVLQQSTTVPSGVYCADVVFSSYSYEYGMAEGHWVTHVDDVATPDIDSFERAVNACQDNEYVRVKVISSKAKPNVLTIKTCYHYWPTRTLVKDQESAEGWRYI
ncbi:hypothetical protein GGI17_001807 [Coemansia sp. S146]|nr:hypothetical protein GGI17_001807 [Coemansia sp. S146]